jgi:hypothetical protein
LPLLHWIRRLRTSSATCSRALEPGTRRRQRRGGGFIDIKDKFTYLRYFKILLLQFLPFLTLLVSIKHSSAVYC